MQSVRDETGIQTQWVVVYNGGETIMITRKETRLKNRPGSPTIIASTYLQQNFGDVMRRAHNQRETFVVQRNGLSVFVIVPVGEYDALTQKQR